MEHGWVQIYLKAWHRRSGNRQETGRQYKQDDLASSDGLALASFLEPGRELLLSKCRRAGRGAFGFSCSLLLCIGTEALHRGQVCCCKHNRIKYESSGEPLICLPVFLTLGKEKSISMLR